MSSVQEAATAEPSTAKNSDDKLAQLAQLLPEFPDIFESHPELLDSLNLHHNTGGAVSLIERQVKQLRDSNMSLREQMQILLVNARDNEQRVGNLNRLACALLESGTVEALLDTLGRHLADDFGISCWALYHDSIDALAGLAQTYKLPETGAARTALENSLRTGQTEFSVLNEELSEDMLHREMPAGSAAIVPLQQMDPAALLVLASEDGEKFRPDSGALVLGMLGELVAASLKRYCAT